MEKKSYTVGIVIAFVVIAALFVIGIKSSGVVSDTKYLELAKCLKEKEVVFYGAFWCPHCRAQKNMFGGAASELPYVECSTPDGKEMKQMCRDAGVQEYPTWKFADGSMITGEQKPEFLAEKAGCPLPQESENSTASTTPVGSSTKAN